MTVWKVCAVDPNYLVSEFGQIITAKRKILKLTSSSRGYLLVSLSQKQYRVNRVVCETFHGPAPSPFHHAAHKDSCRDNNAETNLYWATPQENADDIARRGSLKGEKHGRSILTEQDVRSIRQRRANGETLRTINKDYPVCYATISHIANNRNWKTE